MTFLAALIRVLLGALVAAAVGYSVSRFFSEGLSKAERIAWAFAAGLLVQAILFLTVLSVLPGPALVPLLVLDAILVAASLLARRPATTPSPRSRGEGSAVVVALLAIAATAWLVFLVSALSEPMWATDYLAMWGLKGKTIFESGSVPSRLFQDPALSWGRPDHPLLVPLSLATLASLSGGWNDQALALFFPLCELATILSVWGFLARRVSPLAGACAAALVSVCFPLYRAVHAGLAEIPLAFALVLASCAFFDTLGTGPRSAMTRLFLASLLSAWIKPEGTLFVLLLAGLLWVRRRLRLVDAWKSGGWALVVPPALHASLMFLLCLPRAPQDFDPTFFEPRRWSELLSRFGMVVARIVGTEMLAAWIPLLAIGLFFLLTRRGLADPLLAVFALQILAYFAAFAISSFDPMWKVDSCFDRIVATLFPPFALVLGARLPDSSAPGKNAPGTARGSARKSAEEVADASLKIRPAGDPDERCRV